MANLKLGHGSTSDTAAIIIAPNGKRPSPVSVIMRKTLAICSKRNKMHKKSLELNKNV